MSGKSYAYFGLVGTGLIIWERIDGSTSLGEIVSALVEEFEADEEQIWADVNEFVSALDAADLLEV